MGVSPQQTISGPLPQPDMGGPLSPHMGTPPGQPRVNGPQPGLAEMKTWPGEPVGPALVGMRTPLPEVAEPPGMYAAQAPQAGGAWQNWENGAHKQMQPGPGQLGNVYAAESEQLGNAYAAGPGQVGNMYAGAQVSRGINGQAGQGGALPVGGLPGDEELHPFVRPITRWISLGSPVAGMLLLLSLVFFNPDWATGAMISGLLAIILAILLVIGACVRVALGMLSENNPRRRVQVASAISLVLLLLLFSGMGLSQQNGLHLAQARYLEAHQSWSTAIAEYQAAGENTGSAVDVARTYDEWGEAQNKQQEYAGAVTSFSIVLEHYQQDQSELSRARSGIIAAYLGWAGQAAQQQDYAGATAHYNALLALAFCSSAANCAPAAQSRDATAYYHLGEQMLARRQYVQAVNAYQTLTARFPNAPESGQIHAHYAQALWGQGQQQLSSACSNALSTYRLLARSFADTSEGKQAAIALTKPVPLKGRFTQSVPGSPYHPTAYLVKGLTVGIQQYQFPPLLEKAPAATIHSDGTFSFASVPRGTYELVWSSDNTLHFYYAYSGKQVLYIAHVGPLCTFDYGAINEAIPTTK
jgi:tetratricopeptide (TPR) repeat protein